MEEVRELFIEAVAKQELRTANIAKGFLSFIEQRKKGSTTATLVRKNGDLDVGLFNENGEEYKGFWFEYFHKLLEASYMMGLELGVLMTGMDAMKVLDSISEMGFNDNEASAILATEVTLMMSDKFPIGYLFDDDEYREWFAERLEMLND